VRAIRHANVSARILAKLRPDLASNFGETGDKMMTEAELWNAHLLALGNGNGGLESSLAIIFAYLAAAYFAGAKLTRFQATLGTVGFVMAFGLTAFMTFVEYRRCIYFIERLSTDYGVEPFAPNLVMLPFIAVVMALLIPGCIYFMHQVRSSPTRGKGTH